MKDQWTLRLHMTLEVKIPCKETIFQALVLAFWRFQAIGIVELFKAALEAIEERLVKEMQKQYSGCFRNKGKKARTLKLPFGTLKMGLVRLRDEVSKKTICPLREFIGFPKGVRWAEETLLPGYNLCVIQSYREGSKVLKKMGPQEEAPSHQTLWKRFQGFAEGLEVVPDLKDKRGPKPSTYQMADGTKVKCQDKGKDAGIMEMRLVVGSRSPQGRLEVLDYSVGDSWKAIADRVKEKFPTPPKVLVSDGEEGVEVLCGERTKKQRCVVHGNRGLAFALYQDGYKKRDRKEIEWAYWEIEGLRKCQEEVNSLANADKETIKRLLEESEKAFERLKEKLSEDRYPNTRKYVLNLIEDGLTYLRWLLKGGKAIEVSTNRLENIWSQVVLRIKKIGKRWSADGAKRMLGACLVYALHPERFAELEKTIRGEYLPVVSILILSITTEWVDTLPPIL